MRNGSLSVTAKLRARIVTSTCEMNSHVIIGRRLFFARSRGSWLVATVGSVRGQAVRLPNEFRFDTDEVDITKQGDSLIISPKTPTAAHVRSMNAVLVSNCLPEFERVPDLSLENWTTA